MNTNVRDLNNALDSLESELYNTRTTNAEDLPDQLDDQDTAFDRVQTEARYVIGELEEYEDECEEWRAKFPGLDPEDIDDVDFDEWDRLKRERGFYERDLETAKLRINQLELAVARASAALALVNQTVLLPEAVGVTYDIESDRGAESGTIPGRLVPPSDA